MPKYGGHKDAEALGMQLMRVPGISSAKKHGNTMKYPGFSAILLAA